MNDIETFEDAKKLMEYAFTDYDTVRPHSSIEYLSPDEFERRWNCDENFRKEFVEERKTKEKRRVKNRIEKGRRLKKMHHWKREYLSRIRGLRLSITIRTSTRF